MTAPLLRGAPSVAELSRLYHELAQIGGSSVGEHQPWPYRPKSREQLIALAGEMLRYDARLLSVLVQWFASTYRTLNPLELRQEMKRMRWPQSLLVVLDFTRLDLTDSEFHYFADYVAAGFARVEPAERFFIDTESPASRGAVRNLGRNLAPYARWGFVGRERPIIDPVSKRALGHYDAETRRRILDDLVSRHETFTTNEYLDAIDHGISRQQALADLRAHGGLARLGSTRGRGAKWGRSRRAPRAQGRSRAELRK